VNDAERIRELEAENFRLRVDKEALQNCVYFLQGILESVVKQAMQNKQDKYEVVPTKGGFREVK